MTTSLQLMKDERLLWAYFCATVCGAPGQYLLLIGGNVASTELALSLGARVSQVGVIAAVLYLIGDHAQRYARARTPLCVVLFTVLWLLHLLVNMKVLVTASNAGCPLVGAGSVCCSIALAFAFQICMPLVPGRLIPDLAVMLAAAGSHLLGSSYVLEAESLRQFAGSLLILLLIAPALLNVELCFPCLDSIGKSDEREEDEPLVKCRRQIQHPHHLEVVSD